MWRAVSLRRRAGLAGPDPCRLPCPLAEGSPRGSRAEL